MKPILLVEDDPADAAAVQRALRESRCPDAVVHVRRATEALTYLQSQESVRPAMILLNLHLPDADGLEFLDTVKSDPTLQVIPVVALTSSQEPRDVLGSFNLGIAGYMLKSPDYAGLVETLAVLQDYWTLSQRPARRA